MNTTNIKFKGKLAGYFTSPLKLGIILIIANILIYVMHWPSGLVLSLFLIVFFVVAGYLYLGSRATILNEMVNFATEYGSLQNSFLKNLQLPYAMLDEKGNFIWMNEAFEKLVGREKTYHGGITTLFPEIKPTDLPTEEKAEVGIPLEIEGLYYKAKLTRVLMDSLSDKNEIIDTGGKEALTALYLFDETAEQLALQEVEDSSLVIGLIYIDNYDEVMESTPDENRSLFGGVLDRMVNRYVSSVDGICSKTEKDKYLVILRKKSLQQLEENRFSLLSDMKASNYGNEIPATVSIGVGLGGLTYSQSHEFAKNAINLALARGGDQAVVKTSDETTYYGGKTQSIEKNTRVRARVKAEALKEILSSKDVVYIMGHRIADIDSFGACVGVYRIAQTLHKKAHIVLNEVNSSLQPIVDLFRNNPDYEEDMLITSSEALEKVGDGSAVVVVDVNKPSITECPELLHKCSAIVVLDHHREGTEKIENATLSYIEGYASSTCEMVAEVLQYTGENVKIRSEEADAMYGGIVVDTNNFMSKTGVRTFEAAAFLRRNGADVTRVRKLFREDANEYKAKADTVSQAEIFQGIFAISVCPTDGITSPTVIGAQAANELLDIKGVRGSFVLTEYQDQIFISARSIDEVNVQVIMERMGGGGHMNTAGCQLNEGTLEEAIAALKQTIVEMQQEGEIET